MIDFNKFKPNLSGMQPPQQMTDMIPMLTNSLGQFLGAMSAPSAGGDIANLIGSFINQMAPQQAGMGGNPQSFGGLSNTFSQALSNALSTSPRSYIQPINKSSSNDGNWSLDDLKSYAQKIFPDNENLQRVALTQAVLEGGGPGKWSGLAKQGGLFGIKDPNGVTMQTKEDYGNGLQNTSASFATNSSPIASFQQYANLLNKPRYANVISAQNPYDAFNALQKAGYATDRNYSNKLTNIYDTQIAPLFGD